MTNAWDWQGKVGDNWAAEWQRTDRSFAALNAVLVDRIVEHAGSNARILDIGCGAGQTSLDIAARLPDATVKGIDLSPTLIEAALARGTAASFEVCDATKWDGGNWLPDLLVSRHGVMFFDDSVAAFIHLAKVAAPNAKLVFSCFRERSANDWMRELLSLLPEQPQTDPGAPGPFAFADPARVEAILSAAGWKDVSAEPIDFDYIAGAGDDPAADAVEFFSRIGPAAPVIRTLDADARIAFFDRLTDLLRNHLDKGNVSFKAAAWIWTAHL